MKQQIKGIHHVSLTCCGKVEFEKTLGFYRDVLGLAVQRSWGIGDDAGAMLDTGGGLLEIFANGRQPLHQGVIRHVALAAEDVDACVEAVRAAGYPVLVEPKDIVIQSEPPYRARIAFFEGPVGEQVELFQERT